MIYQSASLLARLVATFIDLILMSIIAAIISVITGMSLLQKIPNDWRYQLLIVLYLAILPVLWNGCTIGKRAVQISIVKRNGTRLDYMTMLLREGIGLWGLGVLTFGVTILVSICMVAFLKDKRAIHDYVAGTYVTIRNK